MKFGMMFALTLVVNCSTIDGPCLLGEVEVAGTCHAVCYGSSDCNSFYVCTQIEDDYAVCLQECSSNVSCNSGTFCRWIGSPRFYTHVCYPEGQYE